MKKTVIELKDITKSFATQTVLNKLSLKIKTNEVLGIIGPSGCGKSTLFRVLLGYYFPESGKVYFNGEELRGNFKKLRKVVGYTTQEDSFYMKLTVFENMKYYARLYGVKRRGLNTHINQILEDVELYDARKSLVENLSGGMRRRLNFAISLVHDPTVLILDEPTTGLDPHLVTQFWNIVETIRKKNKTIIVTSHIFSELEDHCSRVAIMKKGKIAQITKPKDLLKKFEKEL